MPASTPASVIPVAVTVFPLPTCAVSNVPFVAAHVTVSPASTPVSEQPLIDAVVVRSYVLFAAVTDAVTLTAVMLAVVVAVVEASE